ncbi:hypothetical protein F511_42873 [Dorcoceras hygrometricum]|uniref:Uncharacterized protein n=1 Tax=Dorcoceras hygrometricum TaxID=472368 RepID=A0A2Z7A6M8_9LAMI|nr:hypothetical protein F511_42873 [Dorcoceras hygrometricum]
MHHCEGSKAGLDRTKAEPRMERTSLVDAPPTQRLLATRSPWCDHGSGWGRSGLDRLDLGVDQQAGSGHGGRSKEDDRWK